MFSVTSRRTAAVRTILTRIITTIFIHGHTYANSGYSDDRPAMSFFANANSSRHAAFCVATSPPSATIAAMKVFSADVTSGCAAALNFC